MHSVSVRQWFASAALFLLFGAVAVFVEFGNSPSVASAFSLLAVLSLLLGVTLSPRVLFGPVSLKLGDSPLFSSSQSGTLDFSRFPKPLALGLVGFAFCSGASVIARHL